jgi:hypothetical protein
VAGGVSRRCQGSSEDRHPAGLLAGVALLPYPAAPSGTHLALAAGLHGLPVVVLRALPVPLALVLPLLARLRQAAGGGSPQSARRPPARLGAGCPSTAVPQQAAHSKRKQVLIERLMLLKVLAKWQSTCGIPATHSPAGRTLGTTAPHAASTSPALTSPLWSAWLPGSTDSANTAGGGGRGRGGGGGSARQGTGDCA